MEKFMRVVGTSAMVFGFIATVFSTIGQGVNLFSQIKGGTEIE